MDKLVFDFEFTEGELRTGEIRIVRGAGTLFCIETMERNGVAVIYDNMSGRLVSASLLDEAERLNL